jgi:hypothetical protein
MPVHDPAPGDYTEVATAMMNGRPVGVRKRVQYLVILAILAWATQILVQQWGFGAPPAAPPGRPEHSPNASELGEYAAPVGRDSLDKLLDRAGPN